MEAQGNDNVPGELIAGETNAALLELDHVIPSNSVRRLSIVGTATATVGRRVFGEGHDRLEAAIGRLNGVEACGATIWPLAAA